MHSTIAQRVQRAIEERIFPGCVIGVARAKGERTVWPFGTLRYDASQPVTTDAVYDLASITKSIPTASLALTLISQGRLKLTDKVKNYLPELQNDRDATIEDLLRYRVGGVRMSTLRHLSANEIQAQVLQSGFTTASDTSVYTNLPAFVLGLVLERIAGESLDAQARRVLFEPLAMRRTSFFPEPARCAPTEVDEKGEVCGLPHDESARVFARSGQTAGHAGLFSTADDLAAMLEALLRGADPHIADGARLGLGWQRRDARFMGKYCTERTFGKTGFTGTSLICDTDRGIGLVVLSNRTYPTRPSSDDEINRFRRDIADIVFAT